jgi:hypothetical protein
MSLCYVSVNQPVSNSTPDTEADTAIFGVAKSDTDTDTMVLRCRRCFLILNPTLFAFFSLKTQKNYFGVTKTDTDTGYFGVSGKSSFNI